jgi:hypothetical protein
MVFVVRFVATALLLSMTIFPVFSQSKVQKIEERLAKIEERLKKLEEDCEKAPQKKGCTKECTCGPECKCNPCSC